MYRMKTQMKSFKKPFDVAAVSIFTKKLESALQAGTCVCSRHDNLCYRLMYTHAIHQGTTYAGGGEYCVGKSCGTKSNAFGEENKRPGGHHTLHVQEQLLSSIWNHCK